MRSAHPKSQDIVAARRSRRHDNPHTPTPVAVIEAQLSPSGEPVLGLYLHVTYHKVMSTFGRKVGHGQVTPAIIGVIAMLAEHPGISQARLARLMGLERATIGATEIGRASGRERVRVTVRDRARSTQ